MLNLPFPANHEKSKIDNHFAFPARQGGVVLMISLIILVALTIGGLALVRSIDTTNIIAGNLAFQQAATHSAEAGTERAIQSLETFTLAALQSNDFSRAYAAATPAGVWAAAGDAGGNPANWEDYWRTVVDVSLGTAPGTCAGNPSRVCKLAADAAGNIVSYTIQRLCQTTGDPEKTPTGCAAAPERYSDSGNSLRSGVPPLPMMTQYYYRITTRVAGPRNTVSYIQTIVAK
jgi:Tfp pilus assembly protein PilX